MAVKISGTLRGLRKTKRAIAAASDRAALKLANRLLKECRKRTPRDSGRARAGWKVETRNGRPVVVNNTPYIGVLDKGGFPVRKVGGRTVLGGFRPGPKTQRAAGRGIRSNVSRKAPLGITAPALKAVEKKAKGIIGKEIGRALR